MDRDIYIRDHDPEGGHHFEECPSIPHIIESGMIEFTEETAPRWGGPYPGNCALYWLEDYNLYEGTAYKKPFPTRQEAFEASKRWYEKHYRNPDKRMRAFLRDMTVDNCEVNYSHPTSDTPVALRLRGNDDTSYTKFYPTVEAARKDLDLFLACEPLDFQDVLDAGFGFTN